MFQEECAFFSPARHGADIFFRFLWRELARLTVIQRGSCLRRLGVPAAHVCLCWGCRSGSLADSAWALGAHAGGSSFPHFSGNMYERHKRRYSLCDISKVDARAVDVVLLKVGCSFSSLALVPND